MEAAAALAIQEASESVAAGMVWAEYIAERKPYWSESHYLTTSKLCTLAGLCEAVAVN